MSKLKNVGDVYVNQHEPVGSFNLLGNVSEMNSAMGIAMGGSYHGPNTDSKFQQTFGYEGPQAWIGLHCVFEIIN